MNTALRLGYKRKRRFVALLGWPRIMGSANAKRRNLYWHIQSGASRETTALALLCLTSILMPTLVHFNKHPHDSSTEYLLKDPGHDDELTTPKTKNLFSTTLHDGMETVDELWTCMRGFVRKTGALLLAFPICYRTSHSTEKQRAFWKGNTTRPVMEPGIREAEACTNGDHRDHRRT